MNNHTEIQGLLAAYCGGDLEQAERALVDKHLAQCPDCRAELTDLQTVLRLVSSTPEVEPPPWMTARIMARIREQQAGKRSWLQRIFFPLHIKLPLEAVALLLVCVSGYYLSRTVENDLLKGRQQQQLQELPLQMTPPTPPSIDTQTGRKEKTESITAPAPDTRQQKPLVGTETSAPGAPMPYTPPPPALRDQYPAKGDAIKASPSADVFNRALETAPEKKAKSSRGFELRSHEAAPAATGRMAESQSGSPLPQATVRLSAHDALTAPAAIHEAVRLSGGTIVDEQTSVGQRLKFHIQAARLQELLERLQQLGRIVERPAPPPVNSQMLELTIQW